MKALKFIYVLPICVIFLSIYIVAIIIAFPLCLIVEIFTLVEEMISYDKYEHGAWVKFIEICWESLSNIYRKIME